MNILPLLLVLWSCHSSQDEWKEYGCGILKKNSSLTPNELMAEYMKRDSQGEFWFNQSWLSAHISCPHFMPKFFSYNVISSSKLVKKDETHFEVTYFVTGEAGTEQNPYEKCRRTFTQGKEIVTEKYELVKTTWGWRIPPRSALYVDLQTAAKDSDELCPMPEDIRNKILNSPN